jgi:hypothetical protein
MNFIGTYANLAGSRIGNFYVEELASRNPQNGAPRWKVRCQAEECGYPVVLDHARLWPIVQGRATQNSLRCGNPACQWSREKRHVDTLDSFRRQEKRRENEEAAVAAERLSIQLKQAAVEKAREAKDAAIAAQYRRYFIHQIKTDIEQSKIISFSRWSQLTEGDRQRLLDICDKQPDAKIYFSL